MRNKFIVTLRQGTFKPDGTQVLAVYGTVCHLVQEDKPYLMIGGRLDIARSDVYTIVEHDSAVNQELIWVL